MRHLSPSRRRTSHGFTLVELLVVIAIIGTLVALLLPAVQNAREAGRNNTCKNNIRQLALAMTNYDSNTGKLPGYINDLENPRSGKDSNGQYNAARQASWVVMAFPYLEANALWDNWNDLNLDLDAGGAGNTPELAILECPSNPRDIAGNPWTSYVANSGQMFTDNTRSAAGTDNQENAANGVFIDRSRNLNALPSSGAADGREDRNLAQVSLGSILDGTSNTVMFSENNNAFYWTYTNSNGDPVAESTNKDTNFVDDKKWFGFVWTNDGSSDCSSDWLKINGIPAVEPPLLAMSGMTDCHAYPSSYHPDGVNMAFCDGRVQYVLDNVDPTVYGQLMTSNSRRSWFAPGGVRDSQLPPLSDDSY